MKELSVIVKSNKGLRTGKGFSLNEVRLAGLNSNDVKKYKIACDKRRKSFYSHNIETLKNSVKKHNSKGSQEE